MNRVIFNALFVVCLGSFLHFAWELSGRSAIVAVFAAVNESTWEHLKMAFWPAFFLAVVHRKLFPAAPGLLPATAVRTLLPPILIVLIFYSYVAILGHNSLLLDIGTFVIAVFAGEFLGERLMFSRPARVIRWASMVSIVVMTIGFISFSFTTPQNFLFEDPKAQPHMM